MALVTGASSGIGKATALALAQLGAAVGLAARRTDRLDDLAIRLRAGGSSALVLTADVTDERQARETVERTVNELGRLDTLVNNAGVMLLGPVVGAPVEEWERMVSTNLLGLLYCAHAALPHLLRAAEQSTRRVADLVNVSSVAGRETRNGSGVYNATKHFSGFVPVVGAPLVAGVGPSVGQQWGNEGQLGWKNFSTEIGVGAGGARYVGLTQSYSWQLPVSFPGW